MTKRLERSCPICSTQEGMVLHTQKFILEKDNPLPSQYDVVQCSQCGFIFADTEATQEIYDLFYRHFSKYEDTEIGSGSGGLVYDEKRLIETAKCIDSYLQDKSLSILDIGSGNGGLLQKLNNLGYRSLCGLDPSEACVRNMHDQALEAYRGSLLDDTESLFGSRKFDVIILSHVLEHIRDLSKAIQNISGLLNRNGKIYIEVPDAMRYKDYFRVPYYYFDMEHINHFTDRSMELLMMSYGMRKQSVSTKDLEISPTIRYPVFFAFFEMRKQEDAEAVLSFVSMSKALNEYDDLFNTLIEDGEKVVVWGAGNFTKRLLSTTGMQDVPIAFFVDKDANKQGGILNGIDVKSPTALETFKGPVLIVSALYAEDIHQEVMAKYPREKIIVLRS